MCVPLAASCCCLLQFSYNRITPWFYRMYYSKHVSIALLPLFLGINHTLPTHRAQKWILHDGCIHCKLE